ncbi:MAG: glycosyltransferase [Coriobacteriales bacterium]|jgi:glycosyltransferase involved in cell wall biosynthesis|nr:glycosyltransferase [Coriobacteriales bacterium]
MTNPQPQPTSPTPTDASTTPLISILVPIYNVERYLRQCLDSIVGQTLRDMEIICINDGSTDGSLAIIEQYAAADARIRIINKPNSGYGDSMNQGLDSARGRYLGIVESDDWAEPQMFAELVGLAEQHQVEVVRSNFYHYFSKGELNNKLEVLSPRMCDRVVDPRQEHDIFFRLAAIWSAIYRRDFLEANQIRFLPTPGASYQDTSFNFKVWACARRAWFTPKAYLHYRLDNESSSVNSKDKVFCVADELAEMEQFVRQHDLLSELGGVLTQRKIDIYSWNLSRLSGSNAQDFLAFMHQQLQTAKEQNLVDYSILSEDEKWTFGMVVADPQGYLAHISGKGFKQRLRRAAAGISYKLSPSVRRQRHIANQVAEISQTSQLLAEKLQALEARQSQRALEPVGAQVPGFDISQTSGDEAMAGEGGDNGGGGVVNGNGDDGGGGGGVNSSSSRPSQADSRSPLVSIIVPVYNVEPYLRDCLDSLINQTLKRIEIICINDGSSDGSGAILAEYAARDPRVVVLTQENQGQAVARNRGLDRASAPYIMSCDSDDTFAPQMCEKMLATLQHTDVDAVFCDWNLIYDIPEELKHDVDEYSRLKFFGRVQLSLDELVNTDVSLCNKIFKKEIIDRMDIRLPEGLLFEDAYFFDAYMTAANYVYYLHEPLYNYLRREQSTMSDSFSKGGKAADYLEIAFRIHAHYARHNLQERFRDFFWHRFLQCFAFSYDNLSGADQQQVLQAARNFVQQNQADFNQADATIRKAIDQRLNPSRLSNSKLKSVALKLYTRLSPTYALHRRQIEANEKTLKSLNTATTTATLLLEAPEQEYR